MEQQLDYWRRQLDGAPTILELPADKQRSARRSLDGAYQSAEVSAVWLDALRDLGRRESASLFMVLLAAFKVLLHRYTGKTDLVIGTPIANRNQPHTHGVLGFFVNTLVVRSDISGDPSFRDYLGRVRKVALDAYAHQDLPFERLVEELQPARRLSHTPLFQVLFAHQTSIHPVSDAWQAKSAIEKAASQPGLIEVGTAKFDLTLFTEEIDGRLSLVIEYSTDLFDDDRIARMLGHLATLLAGVASDPDQPVSRLPLLTAAERAILVERWSGTAAPYPDDLRVTELFERQVARTPDAIAVAANDAVLTYAALEDRANQMAHRLQAAGIGPDIPVALAMERSADLIVALLAVLKAGGAYVPLDPDYPKARLAWMLADTATPVLITQAHLAARLPAQSTTTLVVVDDPEERAAIAARPQNSSRMPRQRGQPCLHHVHIGLDRPTQGRHGRAPADRTAFVRAILFRSVRGRALFAIRADILRCLDIRDLGRPASRCHARRGTAGLPVARSAF